MITQQSRKNSNSDLQQPQHHAKTFTSFAAPIDLTLQSTTQIGTGATMQMPTCAASLLVLSETAGAAECVFQLGIGADLPVQVTVRRGTTVQLRGAWTSIQSATGGTPEAIAFWSL